MGKVIAGIVLINMTLGMWYSSWVSTSAGNRSPSDIHQVCHSPLGALAQTVYSSARTDCSQMDIAWWAARGFTAAGLALIAWGILGRKPAGSTAQPELTEKETVNEH